MDKITVSVYCLVYNHEKYIRDALNGFVKQKTNFRYEVFVHDDASTDNSRTIIEEYVKAYPDIFIPIFQTENQFSKGVKIFKDIILPCIKGKYIAICEGDDYWIDENKLQKQVDFLENNEDYVACVHNNYIFNVCTDEKKIMFERNGDRDLKLSNLAKGGSTEYQLASLMYRSSIQEERPDFLDSMGAIGDYPLSVYMAMLGKIRFLDEIMSVYRFNRPGSWTAENSGNFDSMVSVSKSAVEMLKMADLYSKGRYSHIFAPIILQHKFDIRVYSGDYSVFSDVNFLPIVTRNSFGRNLKLKKRCLLIRYMSNLYSYFRKKQ